MEGLLPESHRHSTMQIEHDPEAAADHDDDENSGEHDRQEVLARRRLQIQVQEIAQVNQDLDDGGNADNDQYGRLWQRIHRNQGEWNYSQNQSEHKTSEVDL